MTLIQYLLITILKFFFKLIVMDCDIINILNFFKINIIIIDYDNLEIIFIFKLFQ